MTSTFCNKTHTPDVHAGKYIIQISITMDILALLNAILSQKEPDVASMQAFDAACLAATTNKQMHALAEYVKDNLPIRLSLPVDETGTTTKTVGSETFMTITVSAQTVGRQVQIEMSSRYLLYAKAFMKVSDEYEEIDVVLDDKTLTVSNITNTTDDLLIIFA